MNISFVLFHVFFYKKAFLASQKTQVLRLTAGCLSPAPLFLRSCDHVSWRVGNEGNCDASRYLLRRSNRHGLDRTSKDDAPPEAPHRDNVPSSQHEARRTSILKIALFSVRALISESFFCFSPGPDKEILTL